MREYKMKRLEEAYRDDASRGMGYDTDTVSEILPAESLTGQTAPKENRQDSVFTSR